MSTAYDIILEPIMTEKSVYMLEQENKATFQVKYDATKPQIKAAVEELFDVSVEKVNTLIMPSQPRRVGQYIGESSAYKKAYVTLSDDDFLDFYALDSAGQEAGTV